MRYWINLTGSDPADADWYDTLAEAEDAALDLSANMHGLSVQIGTFNLGGPSYTIKEVFA